MKRFGPIPAGYQADDRHQLLIGGQQAGRLAEAGKTPLFVYDMGRMAAQADRFRAAFPSGVALHYAVKANPWEPLLTFLERFVDGFDVASAGELRRVAELGKPV